MTELVNPASGVRLAEIADSEVADVAKAVFERQQIERFGFDVEALFVAKQLGFRIAEIPVRWNHVEGSKVGMLNGAQSFLDLAKIRWCQMTGKYR